MIARRADTKARADFATWKMMAKLNGASALPAEAQRFLGRYNTFLTEMTESEATDATINLVYKSYYAEMGGVGTPPDVRAGPNDPVTDNVTAFKRPPASWPKPASAAAQARPRLPVALIFACLAAVYVGFRYFWR
ncbi:hypothetical protein [Bradyrhizobium sp.]|uniref:hypothetical protein n=1 Tax=Bradyrhizobium sp. TaxID=376 RepID=UPI002E0CA7C1|nr:hypothetical protein [Bradyrhizobium sp.]